MYEFRVQAATVVGAGDFSDPREFRTAPGGKPTIYLRNSPMRVEKGKLETASHTFGTCAEVKMWAL